MSEKLDTKLLSKFLDQLEKMINSREEMTSWLKEFIDDIKNQEIAINSAKTGGAVLGAVSFVGLFTPFAPLAVAGMVGAGVAGVGTAIGDLIANKVKGGNLEAKVETMKAQDSELENLQKELNAQAEILAKRLDIPKDDAILFLLVGVPKMAAQVGVQVVKGTVEIARILPHLNAIKETMKLGASFTQALKLSGTVYQGGRLTVVGGIEGGVVAGTKLVVNTATKVLGGLGAVIGIADAIHSWMSKNPNRKSAEDLLPQLEENLESLKEAKVKFEEMKKM